MDFTISVTSKEVSRDLDELVKRDEELVDELTSQPELEVPGLAGFTTDTALGVSFDVRAGSIEQAATWGVQAVRAALANLGLPPDPRVVEIQVADQE